MIPQNTDLSGSLALAGLVLALALSGTGTVHAESTLETPDGEPVLDLVGEEPADYAASSALLFAKGRGLPDRAGAARLAVQPRGHTATSGCAHRALGRVAAWWQTTLEKVRGLWLRACTALFGSRN